MTRSSTPTSGNMWLGVTVSQQELHTGGKRHDSPLIDILDLTINSYHCERYFKNSQVNERLEVLLDLSYV